MEKLLWLAAVIALPLACFYLISGPLHMPLAGGLRPVVIALMAVAVHKLIEAIWVSYRRVWAYVLQRIRAALAWLTRQAGRVLAYLVERLWLW